MAPLRIRPFLRATLATVAMATAVVGVGESPALAASAVKGTAYGYYTNVSLFGGPYDLRGYGQPGTAPAIAATPSVTLPSTGGSVSLTDSDGSMAQYGPATIFGWWYPATQTYGSSGSQTVYTAGTISGSGSVLSRATVNNAGPGPLVMPTIVTTCQASGSTTIGSVSVTNGYVETSYYVNTQEPLTFQTIPSSPSQGYRINGTIDHVGDSFHIIFNEQTVNPDGSRTVIGAHMYLDGPTALGDMVVASATCGVTP